MDEFTQYEDYERPADGIDEPGRVEDPRVGGGEEEGTNTPVPF